MDPAAGTPPWGAGSAGLCGRIRFLPAPANIVRTASFAFVSRYGASPSRARHSPAQLRPAQLCSAMPRVSVVEAKLCGDEFVQFLRDTGREQERRRDTLRSIYNQEFRCR